MSMTDEIRKVVAEGVEDESNNTELRYDSCNRKRSGSRFRKPQ